MPKNVKTDKKKKKSTVTNSGKLKKLNNQIKDLNDDIKKSKINMRRWQNLKILRKK